MLTNLIYPRRCCVILTTSEIIAPAPRTALALWTDEHREPTYPELVQHLHKVVMTGSAVAAVAAAARACSVISSMWPATLASPLPSGRFRMTCVIIVALTGGHRGGLLVGCFS